MRDGEGRLSGGSSNEGKLHPHSADMGRAGSEEQARRSFGMKKKERKEPSDNSGEDAAVEIKEESNTRKFPSLGAPT